MARTQAARSREERPPVEEHSRLPAAEERERAPQRNPPSYKARFGRVEAAVWAHTSDEGRIGYSVTLERSYKDREGKWQRTSSLDEGDLLPAAKALDDAYTWIQKTRFHKDSER
jgi:hypothetical protein